MDVCLASHARCEMEVGVILGSTRVFETPTRMFIKGSEVISANDTRPLGSIY